jgi:hypothetical protein
MSRPLLVEFRGGATGGWQIERMDATLGAPLAPAARLDVAEGPGVPPTVPPRWALRGVTSDERYVERPERTALGAVQAPLGRPAATCAALIPIRKSSAWWDLPQDERRAIFERDSHHIAVGLEYLPEVARRLHHGRDLGEEFDFLTWFEYPREVAGSFEELVARLRHTAEWCYVEREVDIRLRR